MYRKTSHVFHCLLRRHTCSSRSVLRFIFGCLLLVLCGNPTLNQPGIPATTVQSPTLITQTGHSGSITKTVFCRNDSILISASLDSSVRIWSIETGAELRALLGHSGPVNALAVSEDGNRVATGGSDGVVRIWDIVSGESLVEFKTPDSSVTALAFDRRGQFVAIGFGDAKIVLFDVKSRTPRFERKEHIGAITALAFNNTGEQFVSGSADNTALLWETKLNRKPSIVVSFRAAVTAIEFSEDDAQIVLGSAQGEVRRSSIGGKTRTDITANFRHGIEDIRFDANRNVLAFDRVGVLHKLIEDGTGSEGPKDTQIVTGAEMVPASASISDNARFVAVAKGDRSIQIVDVANGASVARLAGLMPNFYRIALNTDGTLLAAGASDHSAKLFELSSGQLLAVLPHNGAVTALCFSNDGRWLITGSTDNKIRIWDASTGSFVRSLQGHNAPISSIRTDENSKTVATADTSGKIIVRNLDRPDQQIVLQSPKSEVVALMFTTKPDRLIFATTENALRYWEVGDQTGRSQLLVRIDGFKALTKDTDTSYVRVVSRRAVERINLQSKTVEATKLNAEPGFESAVTSLDDKYLVSGSPRGNLRIDTLDESAPSRSVEAHVGKIQDVLINMSTRQVLSAGDDGVINILKLDDLKPVSSISTLKNSVDWLVVTPDGSLDGTPRAWRSLNWRFGGDTFEFSTVETYFADYFVPGLLSNVLKNDVSNTRQQRTLADIDRRQPIVEIRTVDSNKEAESVEVTITVTESSRRGSGRFRDSLSGAKDLRLFRNGSLVKKWHGDVFENASGCRIPPVAPQEARQTTCTTRVNIESGVNRFTSYAFSNSNVKSKDSEISISGESATAQKGTLYIFTVGIDKYAASDPKNGRAYDLRYAVADINSIGSELSEHQKRLGNYSSVVNVRLVDKDATKANISTALKRFAGNASLEASSESARQELQKIKVSGPRDAIFFHYSGHGTSRCSRGNDGKRNCDRFYLIPHDGFPSNVEDSERFDDQLYAQSISDTELEGLFEPIDSGDIMMVIDACKSGQALEAQENRRGPMNSAGLAQLAYEKGMLILTASQSQQAAIESGKLGHGLLTYSLLQGMTKAKSTENKEIVSRNWFQYALNEVPILQMESMRFRDAENVLGAKGPKIFFVPGSDPNLPPEKRGLQTPRMFYRREVDLAPFVVSRL